MALFNLFGGKDKKNTEINNTNKSQILLLITQIRNSCKSADALTLLKNIEMQLQGQGESSSKELMAIDGQILKLLTEVNQYVLKQQFPTAISKLNKVQSLAIERIQYCSLGGRKTKQDQKLEDQARRAMENIQTAPQTREEDLQARLDNLNAELESALKEQEQLKALYLQNPNNVAIKSRGFAIGNKIASLRNQVNATMLELQKEGQDQAILETVANNEDLVNSRTHSSSEMDFARAELASQNQMRSETQAQIAQDAALLNQGAAGLFGDDPFADPFQDMAAASNPFADPFGTATATGTAASSAAPAQTQYGGFNAAEMGTSAMASDIRKVRQELQRSIDAFNDKIDDATDDLADLNAELRPLLERRRTASASECLTLDGMIDQINAKRNGVINKIKRYRQANAQLSDKLSLIDKLDTQQDLMASNAKIEQLTNGKFADMGGLAMYLQDAINKSNEELEDINAFAHGVDSVEIAMNSASATSAVLSDVGSLVKDEGRYEALEMELGMTLQ